MAFANSSITENTRGSYPIEHIDGAVLPGVGDHPRHVIFLTCDAFGVLPPVARLTVAQAEYHFMSGYSAKVAGTEVGVTEPEVTFSPCFAGPFLVWPPSKYGKLLSAKLRRHRTTCWLVNTGWLGGPGSSRVPLALTRAILNAIYSGELDDATYGTERHFGLHVPAHCPDVPEGLLDPRRSWSDTRRYDRTARELAKRFSCNREDYAGHFTKDAAAAPPIG